MSESSGQTLNIKKYSNRRFYDTTRSCHVTLSQMHKLVREGHDVSITDYRTGENLTNIVLTQIILERDALKLDMFPSSVLHQMIRTQQQFLGSVVEQFFAQVLESHKASQERWAGFLQNTLGLGDSTLLRPLVTADPMKWTRDMMQLLSPRAHRETAPSESPARSSSDAEETGTAPIGDAGPPAVNQDEVRVLRRQLEALRLRVQSLQSDGGDE